MVIQVTGDFPHNGVPQYTEGGQLMHNTDFNMNMVPVALPRMKRTIWKWQIFLLVLA